ncbi:MAG: NfeD family protein [candidate division NC10 bacterium]|nr:NfeD family protein [candidate division NC10 bacterium]
MAWRAPRGFWAYLILQVPDILLAGLILLLLHWWMALSLGWVLGLFALWVVKDFSMYFLLRSVFTPPRTGPETLVGARAVAREPLAPTGHVLLFGETWRAESLQPHNGGGREPDPHRHDAAGRGGVAGDPAGGPASLRAGLRVSGAGH